MPLRPDRVLLTGGAGFVGACLARKLLDQGLDVHLLTRPDSNPWRIRDLQGRARLHEVDLLDEAAVSKLLPSVNPDVVYHLATYGGYPEQTDPDRILRTNILGLWNLLKACEPTRCGLVVNCGSSSEYGFQPHPTRESDLLDPNSHYAVSKAAATLLCRHVSRTGKIPIATLRLYSVYGPFEEPTRLIPTLIRRALVQEPLVMVDPETGRDFVFIDDVLRAFVAWDRLAALNGDPINIGSGIQSTVRTALDTVLRLTGSRSEVQWNRMPPRVWDSRIWVADITQARARLDWSPEIAFDEGIRRTIDWQRAWKTNP